MAWHFKMEWLPSLFKIPFTLYKSPTLPAPKQLQTITLPSPFLTDVVRHSSSIFLLVLRLTNVLLCDPNTSNFFSNLPLSNVCVLLPILIFSFYWPVWDMAFSLPLCLEGQHPGVVSSLWTLRLAFCGYHLMKLPVEDLWGVLFLKLETLMNLSSCLVVHRGLPLLFLFWLEPICAVLWRE